MDTAERLLREFVKAITDAQNKGGLSAVTPWLSSLVDEARTHLSSSESKESAPHTEMAIAYVFNGTLYWPERLTDEQKSIAIPLFT